MPIMGFIEYLYGLGRADRTVAEYRKWLRRLHHWATERELDLNTLQGHHVRVWADETIPYTWASRKQAKSALNAYYSGMLGRTDDPCTGVRVPRKPHGNPHPLPREQATVLRDTALMAGGREGLATIIGMYGAGRASEIAVGRWDGIDPATNTMRWWRTKTSDWHEVPMHPVLAQTLEHHRPRNAEGYIFVGNNGRPHVTPSTVWTWVRKVGALAGIDVTPQQLRETAAVAVLEATGDIDAAASLLGHRDINVTRQFYTGVTSKARMARAVAALDF